MSERRVYAAMMSYEVSDAEKDQAQKAIRWFNYCVKVLSQCDKHLDLIYNPFKKNSNLTPEEIFKIRSTLRLYRDKVVDNFNEFKKIAFKCYAIIQAFVSDTQVEKLIKSFIASVEDIEVQVNRLVELFSNLKSEQFVTGLIKAIENIKKEITEFTQIVDERVKTHFQTNILARNWIDNVSNELQEKVEKKSPLVMKLMDERMKMLDLPGAQSIS